MADMDHRLDAIEEKLDRLTDAMVSMARAEEKILSLQDNYNKMYEKSFVHPRPNLLQQY